MREYLRGDAFPADAACSTPSSSAFSPGLSHLLIGAAVLAAAPRVSRGVAPMAEHPA
jgi:hypothetical protein